MDLSVLATGNDFQKDTDNLGGSIFDSGLYLLSVSKAYITMSQNNAYMFNVVATTPDGREFKYITAVTSAADKGTKNHYVKDGKKYPLPGLVIANHIALCTTKKPLAQLATEKKLVEIYNFEEKKSVPTEVDTLPAMIGGKFYAGIIKQKVNRRKKNAQTGQYENIAETRHENEIDKIFFAEEGAHFQKTIVELENKLPEAKFVHEWVKRWDGQEKDRTVAVESNGAAGTPQASGNHAPADDMFAGA